MAKSVPFIFRPIAAGNGEKTTEPHEVTRLERNDERNDEHRHALTQWSGLARDLAYWAARLSPR